MILIGGFQTVLEDLLPFAQKTARQAGRIVLRHFGRIDRVDYKTVDSIVTEADLKAEAAIRRAIGRTCPQHQILGEEEGFHDRGAEFTWVVDPLDGTTNFAAGVPLFAVSIALFQKRRPILGVVYDPLRKECYCAGKGTTAFLNGRPIRVNRHRKLTPTTLGAFGSTWRNKKWRNMPTRISSRIKGRNLGSTVLHLVAVATGQMDFAIADETKLWDIAAAGFILQRAGGRLTDLEGKSIFPLKQPLEYYQDASQYFLGSNGGVHREVLRDIIRQ